MSVKAGIKTGDVDNSHEFLREQVARAEYGWLEVSTDAVRKLLKERDELKAQVGQASRNGESK